MQGLFLKGHYMDSRNTVPTVVESPELSNSRIGEAQPGISYPFSTRIVLASSSKSLGKGLGAWTIRFFIAWV